MLDNFNELMLSASLLHNGILLRIIFVISNIKYKDIK